MIVDDIHPLVLPTTEGKQSRLLLTFAAKNSSMRSFVCDGYTRQVPEAHSKLSSAITRFFEPFDHSLFVIDS